MIPFACSGCSQNLQVPDELAGKQVRCPQCNQVVPVPALTASAVPQGTPAADPEAISGAGSAVPVPHEETAEGSVPAQAPPPETISPQPDNAEPTPDLYSFLAPPQAADELGRLGSYRVLQVLGAGGMGVVFKAEDPHLRRFVALKAMLPSLATSPTAKERFFREARAAAALKHDHIVSIHQIGEERGAPFLAMEFLEGESLDDRLKRAGRLPTPEVLRIGREVAEGLSAAHDHGLIHRDIKPGNIWLESRGQGSGVRGQGEHGSSPAPGPSPLTPDPAPLTPTRVKILDFGLARGGADDSHLTQSGVIVGTPAYMPPEQASGGKVDPRCDLYSLGVVLYKMATAEVPFQGDMISLLSALALQTPTEPWMLNQDIPAELNDLIMKLLAKKPEDRPASAQEVADTLRALEGEQQATPLVEGPGPRSGRSQGKAKTVTRGLGAKKGRTPLLLALAGGLAAALVVLVVLIWPQSGDPDKGRNGPKNKELDGMAQVTPEGPLPAKYTNRLGMEFALVPKGKSWLGGGGGQMGTQEVEIKQDFYLGAYEVTQEEWKMVTGFIPVTSRR